jgi:hypothetical protein
MKTFQGQQYRFACKRIAIREAMNSCKNPNRKKRWKKELQKITKRYDNLIWKIMKRRMADECYAN